MTDHEQRLGTQKMLPLIFSMALPAVAAQLVNLLYSIVDRVFIGHIPDVGTDALAGIGITSSIITLIAAFSQIVGSGGAPLAAMALGSGNRERAGKILGNGFVLLIVFSVVLCIPVYIFIKNPDQCQRFVIKKNIYFIPFEQDNPKSKPKSLVYDYTKLIDTIKCALDGKQIQPLFIK